MTEEIMVSVSCLVYNHAKYLRKCLDGFVMQKTNFKFEVLIHDDASTDGSQDIIREYEEKYPDIIKPIYQKENQYSKHTPISKTYQYPRVKGKYIAFCEGDDYWNDPNKLQTQYEYMTSHPECVMSTHEAVQINYLTGEKRLVTNENFDRDFTVDEVIIGGGELFATNSIMMKSKICLKMPKCFDAKNFSDYQYFIFGAIEGSLHYFSKPMSVYNYCVPGSWSVRVSNVRNRKIDHNKELIRMLNEVNRYYNFVYDNAIQEKIRKTEYNIYRLEGHYFKLIQKKYKKYYVEDCKNGKLLIFKECFAIKFPKIYKFLTGSKR